MSVLKWLWEGALKMNPESAEFKKQKREIGRCEHIMRKGDSRSRRDLKNFYKRDGGYDKLLHGG